MFCSATSESVVIHNQRQGNQEIVVIIEHITTINYKQNFIPSPAVKVNSMCRENYWGSSMGMNGPAQRLFMEFQK